MTQDLHFNEHGQPVGAKLEGWQPRALPPRTPLAGHWCRLEPLSVARHAEALYAAYSVQADGRDWTYMPAGPFPSMAALTEYLTKAEASADPLHHTIIDNATGQAVGTLALMRIDPANGVIEVGAVAYSRLVQRTPMGTEAQFLLMQRVFDELGYRRYEWKCNALNAPSRRAAERYGFQFEGIFRQAAVMKGRSRDTAWFAMLDHEWPAIRPAFAQWLAPENFDAKGQQRSRLGELVRVALGR